MVTKIISGGQTGADMGGLLAGELLHIPTGGTCPDFMLMRMASIQTLFLDSN